MKVEVKRSVHNDSAQSNNSSDIIRDIREIQQISSQNNNIKVTVDISPKTFLTFIGILIGIYMVIKLAPIFILLFLSYAIATVLGRSVRKWVNRGVPLWMSIIIVYLISFIIFGVLLWLIVYPVMSELSNIGQITQYFSSQINSLDSVGARVFGQSWINIRTSILSKFQDWEVFTNAGVQTIQNLAKVFTSMATLLTAIILSVYIIVDHDTFIDMLLLQITNSEKKKAVTKLINDVEDKLYLWVRGQGILSTIISFLVWLLLTILGIPLALPLALFAGLLESIPNVGPVMASIPAIFLGFTTRSPLIGVLTILGFILIQQLENNIFVPRIMSDVVGVKPLVVIIGILIGFQMLGIIGALIAVPVLVLLKLVLGFYKDLQKLKAKGLI